MPRKIQILTDLLFIFSWDISSHGIIKSGFPHHHRVETAPAHVSLHSCLKFQLEEQPFPAWVRWIPTAFASMGSWYSNLHDEITSSCFLLTCSSPSYSPFFSQCHSIPYLLGGKRSIFYSFMLERTWRQRGGFCCCFIIVIIERGFIWDSFSVQTSSNLYMCS